MQNLTPVRTNIQGLVTPEIAETLKRARAAEFRLEAEYYHLDWEARCELADDLRDLTDDLTEEQADVIARVASDLEDESEDFSTWPVRCDAARRVRLVIRSLEKEAANV